MENSGGLLWTWCLQGEFPYGGDGGGHHQDMSEYGLTVQNFRNIKFITHIVGNI